MLTSTTLMAEMPSVVWQGQHPISMIKRYGILFVLLGAIVSGLLCDDARAAVNEPLKPISEVLDENSSSLKSLSQADPTKRPCSASYDTRDSDLGAQWKAADAAKDASDAAWFFGKIGTILGALTLAAAVAAAWYARAAANHTKVGTETAKAIGEAQTKAYLTCVSAEYRITKEWVEIKLEIENIGNSPTKEVELFGYFIANETLGTAANFRVADSVRSEVSKSSCQPITTKSRTSEAITFHYDYNFQERKKADVKSFVTSAANEITFAITIRYRDVFGKLEDIPLLLDATVAAHPVNMSKKRSNTGKASVIINNIFAVDYPV